MRGGGGTFTGDSNKEPECQYPYKKECVNLCQLPRVITREKQKKSHVFLCGKPVFLEPSRHRFDTGLHVFSCFQFYATGFDSEFFVNIISNCHVFCMSNLWQTCGKPVSNLCQSVTTDKPVSISQENTGFHAKTCENPWQTRVKTCVFGTD